MANPKQKPATTTRGGAAAPTKIRKKNKRTVTTGEVHILATFNNTIITITDSQGNTVSWQTSGGAGFKGSRKSTPFAAQMAAKQAAQTAKDVGMREAKVYITGPGPGRESAAKALGEFFRVTELIEGTRTPHNGCRPPKERRV